ncbi:transposable element Tcb2 transposase [Trichonephila clavipes]|nr:transposable element Tcb2 transposase [Trichonephila clavipes]
MPPRRNKEKFQQLTEFERGGISAFERRFFYRSTGARVQWNSSAVKRVWKQWTDEHRTTRKTGSGRRKLLPGSWQPVGLLPQMLVYCHRCSVDCLQGFLYTGTLSQQTIDSYVRNGFNEPKAFQADWHQVVFSDESRFKLCDHDGRIRVRRYAGERCLPECVIERHSGLTPEVIVSGAISYHRRSNLLRTEGNLNSNRYVHEVLQSEVAPFLQGIPVAIFQQNNARPHVVKTVRDFCSAQHMQLLPWSAYSPDLSPIEHVWDLVSRCLARDARPAASKDELLLRIQEIWNSLPQADIQNLFDSIPRCIATLITAHGGYIKY